MLPRGARFYTHTTGRALLLPGCDFAHRGRAARRLPRLTHTRPQSGGPGRGTTLPEHALTWTLRQNKFQGLVPLRQRVLKSLIPRFLGGVPQLSRLTRTLRVLAA